MAENARYSPSSMDAQFLFGISKSDAIRTVGNKTYNHTTGRTNISTLAGMFDTQPMMDESASKHKFMIKVSQSRLLHMHTHCKWDVTQPLDHHLEFPRLESTGTELVEEHASAEDLKLTARECFGIRLLPGTHVNLIACAGGLAEVTQGDEVMGLVPALLHAGASSTISTLWPIADKDGANFSDIFFDSFIDQCLQNMVENVSEQKSASFVDIALALQTAAVEMEAGYEPLVRWAGFILHGFWQFPLSRDDAHRLRQKYGPEINAVSAST
jgi:CHAT domain-containing protein